MPNLIGTSSPVEPPVLRRGPHQRLLFLFRSPLSASLPFAPPFCRSLSVSGPVGRPLPFYPPFCSRYPPIPTLCRLPRQKLLHSTIITAISSGLKVSVVDSHGTIVLWHDCTNVRTFPDEKVITLIMPCISTVQYYWRRICSDGKFILSVAFITLIYLNDYYW